MWLDWEYARTATEDEKDSMEFMLAEKGYNGNTFQQPEALKILRMLNNSNTSYWAGGLADQPYFLMMELNAAATGERNRLVKQTANLQKLMDKHG